MKKTIFLFLSTFSLAAGSEQPDFAWQWDLQVPERSDDPFKSIQLTEDAYRHISRSDLMDLAALDGNGQMIPLGPMAASAGEPVFSRRQFDDVPWFAIPSAEQRVVPESLDLHISRDGNGRLQRLDASVNPVSASTKSDILIDASNIEGSISNIDLHLDLPAGEAFSTKVDVLGTDDLKQFIHLGTDLPLFRLQQGSFQLARERLELLLSNHRYFLLRSRDALPIKSISLVAERQLAAMPTPLQSFVLADGKKNPEKPNAQEFSGFGPIPAQRLDIELAETNDIANVLVLSRDRAQDAWQVRAEFTAYSIETQGQLARNLPVDISTTRDRYWQVQTFPESYQKPVKLKLFWDPDRFFVLLQGKPPYKLVAGSVRQTRSEYPFSVLLAEMRAQHGPYWTPAAINIAGGQPLAGVKALEPVPPPKPGPPYKKMVLWAVLLLSVGLILMMVIKTLKTPQPGQDTDRA